MLMRRPLNLVFLIPSGQLGGTEKIVYQLAKHLDPDQFHVTVCALMGDGPLLDMIRAARANVHIFNLRSPLRLPPLFELLSRLRDTRPDILHAFGFRADLIVRSFRRYIGNPILVSGVANTDWPYRQCKKWINRLTVSRTRAYWAISRASAQAGHEKLSIPYEKLHVIYPGMEIPEGPPVTDVSMRVKEELNVPAAAPLVVSLSNLRSQKGYRYAIEAAPAIIARFPQVVFAHVGQDLLGGVLPALANERGVASHFRFLGFCQAPWPFLSAADLFLHPSIYEGFGLAILEAMSLGKPVIASEVGGISELIEHGVNGYLIPPADSQALAQALIGLLSEPERGVELGRRAQETVKERFALDRMVKEFEHLYHQLVEPASIPV